MAKIHGFELRGMKSWVAHEGIGTSGTLYLNGKKLGEYCDYGDGGCPVYRFPHEGLNKLVIEQCQDLAVEYGDGIEIDLDLLVAVLADKNDAEKELRKMWRKCFASGKVLCHVRLVAGESHLAIPDGDNESISHAIEFFAASHDTSVIDYTVYRDKPIIEFGEPLHGAEQELATIAEHNKRVRELAKRHACA